MRFWLVSAVFSVMASTAAGQGVVAEYLIDNPQAGAVSVNYFQFGYTNIDGEFIPLTGEHIDEARVKISFKPGLIEDPAGRQIPFDVEQLRVSMVVPAILDDPNGSELFLVEGNQLVESSPGTFTIDFSTTAFNGEVRPGRFSLDIAAFDDQGEPVPLAGEFLGGSGFYYTVGVPEPMLATMAMGLAMLCGRRRG